MEKSRPRPRTDTLEQERKVLLQKALARPGVREVMQVYGLWQEQDKGLDPYRAATRKSFKITVTSHANTRQFGMK